MVLPKAMYYARTPYGAMVPLGPRLRGLGQDAETISAAAGGAAVDLGTGTSISTSSGSGFNWGSLISNLTGAASKAYQQTLAADFQSQLLSRGLVQTASGQLVSATGALNLNSLLPYLLIGGGLLLVVSMAKS